MVGMLLTQILENQRVILHELRGREDSGRKEDFGREESGGELVDFICSPIDQEAGLDELEAELATAEQRKQFVSLLFMSLPIYNKICISVPRDAGAFSSSLSGADLPAGSQRSASVQVLAIGF